MVTVKANGDRVVELFVPVAAPDGKSTISSLVLPAFEFGHVLDYIAGKHKSALALMVAVTGIEEAVIRKLKYPDADRVMGEFITQVPDAIRESVLNGISPTELAAAAEDIIPDVPEEPNAPIPGIPEDYIPEIDDPALAGDDSGGLDISDE